MIQNACIEAMISQFESRGRGLNYPQGGYGWFQKSVMAVMDRRLLIYFEAVPGSQYYKRKAYAPFPTRVVRIKMCVQLGVIIRIALWDWRR